MRFTRNWWSPLALGLIPAFVLSLLLFGFFRRTLFHFVPVWSDEVIYWLSSNTFATAGFSGGYFVIDEKISPIAAIHFGVHGPFFPVVYGWLAQFLGGWHPYSTPLYHLMFFSSAIFTYSLALRPNRTQTLLIAFLLATFWPFLLVGPTAMQEGYHLSFAVLLAAGFLQLLEHSPKSRGLRFAVFFALLLAALPRPLWSILFLPWMLFSLRPKSLKQFTAATVGASLLIGFVFLVFRRAVSPFPGSFFFIKALSLQSGLSEFIKYALNNLRNCVVRSTVVELTLRAEMLVVVVCCLWQLVRGWRGRGKIEEALLFHVYNLGGAFFCTVFLAIVGSFGDYRVWAPHLLLTLLVLIGTNRRAAYLTVGVALAINLAALPNFLHLFKEYRGANYATYHVENIANFRQSTAPYLNFRSDQSAWCNTVLSFNPPFVSYELVALPPGFGLSAVFDWRNVRLPVKSGYVLADWNKYAVSSLERDSSGTENIVVHFEPGGYLKLKPLATTTMGTLYKNLEAPCN